MRLLLLLLLLGPICVSQPKAEPQANKYIQKSAAFIKKPERDSNAHYWNKALKMANETNDIGLRTECHNALSEILFSMGSRDKAFEHAQKAYNLSKKSGDKLALINAYLSLGNIHFSRMDDPKAMVSYQHIDSIAGKDNIKNDMVVRAVSNIGLLFFRAGNSNSLDQAESYFKKAQAMAIDIRDKEQEHVCGTYLGSVLHQKKRDDEAISYYKKAYDYFKSTSNVLKLPHALYGLAEVYTAQGNHAEAEKYYREFIAINLRTKNTNGLAKAHWAFAKYLFQIGELAKAEAEYETAISFFKSEKQWESGALSQAIGELSQVYASGKKFEEAYASLNEHKAIEDSIVYRKNETLMVELENKYQSRQKGKEIKQLSSQNVFQRYLFIGLLVILLIAAAATYFVYRNKIRTAQKLKEISELKSRFFANISHEFRTPLTLIKSPIQNLQILANDDQKKQLGLIDKNANRMLELVDQLLELSKIDNNSLKLLLKEGNISGLLHAIAEPFAFQAKENDVSFKLDIGKTKQKHYFDADVIEKIATNLLSNAFKYSGENETISFAAQFTGGQLQMQVSNTGSTLKKEDLPKLFERFYQEDSSKKGIGIGLALVRELVELYQGSIKTSVDGGTLQFSVVLPLDDVPGNASPVADAKTTNHPLSNDRELPILLVVDDNAEIRNIIYDIFSADYFVLEAQDAETGFVLARKEIPDCIISDVMMPRSDGYALTRRLKNDELTSFIPVLLLTAKTSGAAHLEGLKSTADAFLTKPFNHEILKASVSQLIAERKKLQERYSRELVLKPIGFVIDSVDEKFLEKLQVVLQQELSNAAFSTDDFAHKLGVSRMQLHRKLKSLIGVPATEFLRNERLKAAAALLVEGKANVSEVAYAVGFNDVSYFSKCFKEKFHATPTQFIEKG